MFGHKDIETTAKVVALSESASIVEVDGKSRYKVVLDVKATDGPVFRVTADHWFETLFSPNAGDVMKVSYDPKSHKTKIHSDGDLRFDIRAHEKRRHQEERVAVDQAMAKPAATAEPAGGTDPYAGAQYDPDLAELVAEERRQREIAQASALPPSSVPTPQAAAATPTPVPGGLSRLQHLLMLRDSSLLTPEEFEILRKQLPAGS
jgi:hypothetical protein